MQQLPLNIEDKSSLFDKPLSWLYTFAPEGLVEEIGGARLVCGF